jgi:hypothetical protein
MTQELKWLMFQIETVTILSHVDNVNIGGNDHSKVNEYLS